MKYNSRIAQENDLAKLLTEENYLLSSLVTDLVSPSLSLFVARSTITGMVMKLSFRKEKSAGTKEAILELNKALDAMENLDYTLSSLFSIQKHNRDLLAEKERLKAENNKLKAELDAIKKAWEAS